MHLFRVDASIRRESSVSQAVADTFQRAWTTLHPGDTVTHHRLDDDPLPYLTLDHVVASATPADRRDHRQHAATEVATTLVDDLMAADVVLMSVPLYNWSIPAQFKSWIDHLFSEPRIAGGQAPFAGRTGVIVSARGGSYRDDAPRAGWDHAVPYLRQVFGEHLGFRLRVILAEFTLADVNPALADFKEQAELSLADAHRTAQDLPRELTADLATRR